MKRKNYKPLTTLVVLAVAAFVAAAFTFTNVTYWVINATRPPAVSQPGNDVAAGGGEYVNVGYYYDPVRGVNITRISILGFKGYPVNYTSVIKVCNRHSSNTIQATLVWVGQVGSTGYEGYIKSFLVGRAVSGSNIVGVGFVGTSTYSTAGPYSIGPGQCIDIGAYVVIDPTLPDALADGRTVLGQYQVDIRMDVP